MPPPAPAATLPSSLPRWPLAAQELAVGPQTRAWRDVPLSSPVSRSTPVSSGTVFLAALSGSAVCPGAPSCVGGDGDSVLGAGCIRGGCSNRRSQP